MATGAKVPQITYPFASDDGYMKPAGDVGSDAPWTDTPWAGDMVTGFPRRSVTVYYFDPANIYFDIAYIIFRNTWSAAYTTDHTTDKILSASIASADTATLVYFRGTVPTGVSVGTPYWVINVVDGVSFQIEATQGSGVPVNLTADGSGTFVLASRRSSSDEILGTYELEPVSSGDGETDQILTYLTDILADTGELQTDWTSGGPLRKLLQNTKNAKIR